MTDVEAKNDKDNEDRRIKRTRAAIWAAFEKLISERDIDKITVTAIAKEADINRKTFYLHYESVDALVDELVRDEATRIANTLSKSSIDESGAVNVAKLFSLLEEEIKDTFRRRSAILHHANPDRLLDRVEPVLTQVIIEKDALRLSEILGPYLEYFVAFFCSGLLAIYRRWEHTDQDVDMEALCTLSSLVCAVGIDGVRETARTRGLNLANYMKELPAE